jgi:hypothetical protein
VSDVVELVSMVTAGAAAYFISLRILAPDVLPELFGSLTGRGFR